MKTSKFFKIKIAALLLCVVFFFFGISGCISPPAAENSGKLSVVTTTTMLYDLACVIGGENVAAISLMGAGIDPHLYQASAGDVTKMQDADVIIYNGLHLEGKMGDIFEALNSRGRNIICAGDAVSEADLLPSVSNSGIYDPHIWFDVNIWSDVAIYISDKFSEFDPENKEAYKENLSEYLVELDELSEYMQEKASEIPKSQRVLITAHDAFGYFGKALDFEVLGLQGISTDAEAGTADVSSLADFISHNKIKSIFVESSLPRKNIEALQAAVESRGFCVQIGGELYSDSLGDELSGHNTYISTCKANIDTITSALK